ncbi:MAG: disulfide bond formation protein B [Rhodobiaceae bacterium]|nr:MAG: disulfide bond formation protein B [Rhodobiaceae bacterium]
MSFLASLPLTNRQIPWLIFAISVSALGSALIFEHVGGLAPCDLCLQQRVPYWVLIPAALLAGALSREANLGIAPLALIALCVVAASVNVGIAGYHAGVEYKWWEGPTGCTGGGLMAGSLAELKQQLAGVKVPRCDEIAWSLFGISMAGYNFLISLGLVALGILPLLRYWTATGVEEE